MEYTEEEKKAIEVAKEIVNKKYGSIMVFEIRDMEKILNLIEKQQKEIEEKDKQIEELKEITEDYDSFPNDKEKTIVMASQSYFEDGTFVEKFIPKEAISELTIKLDNDIKNTRSKLQDIKYDYIRKARLKAFILKMKEIKSALKKLLGE